MDARATLTHWCLRRMAHSGLRVAGTEAIRIWNPAGEKEPPVHTRTGSRGSSARLAHHGRQLASAGRDGKLYLWDVTTGKRVRQFEGRQEGFLHVAFSPDGKLLAAGGLNESKAPEEECPVLIWDTVTGVILHELPRHKMGTHAVVFSPDGKLLVTINWDGTLRLWDSATGKELHELVGRGAYRVSFSRRKNAGFNRLRQRSPPVGVGYWFGKMPV